jgi:hypothetical protein
VGDGRKPEALDAYWQAVPAEHRAAVEAVAMDLWEPYFPSTLADVPEAQGKIVHDPYPLGGGGSVRRWTRCAKRSTASWRKPAMID